MCVCVYMSSLFHVCKHDCGVWSESACVAHSYVYTFYCTVCAVLCSMHGVDHIYTMGYIICTHIPCLVVLQSWSNDCQNKIHKSIHHTTSAKFSIKNSYAKAMFCTNSIHSRHVDIN